MFCRLGASANFKPATSNPQLQTRNFKPATSNPQLQTRNFKPATSNPQLHINNKPQYKKNKNVSSRFSYLY
jgi:hypothetical protein